MKSRLKVSEKLKKEMAARSGGRCQLCSRYLYADIFGFNTDLNELAHNVPYSENGPRSIDQKNVTPKYKVLLDNKGYNSDNLLVLCPTCHATIDKDPEKYTIDYLLKLKAAKERAVLEAGTRIVREVTAIKFSSPIAKKICSISDDEIRDSLFKEYAIVKNATYNFENETIIQNGESYFHYISSIAERTEKLFKQKIEAFPNLLSENFVLFAIAPQPLLIKLGLLFNNYHNVEIREKSRTSGWLWKGGHELNFEIIKPECIHSNQKNISLLLEVSSELNNDEVIDKDADVWRVSVAGDKQVNIVCSNNDLINFEKRIYEFFSIIKEKYGADTTINVYPAMPISLSIKFGNIYMPNAYNRIIIYDKIKNDNGDPCFVKALEIN